MQLPHADVNVFETILARRSVRSYREGALDRRVVQTLLEAAVRAPTAVHEEPWAFVVVQDQQILHDLSERGKPLLPEDRWRIAHSSDVLIRPDANLFYDAGTLIIICASPGSPFVAADCWLAAENLMLAACALGLGTCVIGSALPALGEPEIRAQLGISDEYVAVAPIIVGQPRGTTPATSRRKPHVLAWH
jgi:nitroreductase